MKFAAVVVLFALALGAAHCSVVPLAYTSVGGVVVAAHPHAAVAVPSPVQIISSPAVVPAVVAVAPAGGTYVAQTRGAVHVAPLPGHANSASSVNLQPAPGTI